MELDQYAYVEGQKDFRADGEDHFYWRKHARLHQWAKDVFTSRPENAGISFNLVELPLTQDNIDDLRGRLEGGGLPVAGDGFFRGTEYQEERAEDYRDHDLAFCAWAAEQIAAGETVVYEPWW